MNFKNLNKNKNSFLPPPSISPSINFLPAKDPIDE